MIKSDSAFLIKELKKGNKNAFEVVFKEYYSPLCVFVKKYCNDDNMAEEIVSRFFYNFYNKRKSLNINSSLRSYMFRSVKNTAINYIRDRAKFQFEDVQGDNKIDFSITESGLDMLISKELQTKINNAVDNLPEQCKVVFVKSRFEGKKYKEIAKELNISVNTVETQMSRALRKLRVELKDYIQVLLILLG